MGLYNSRQEHAERGLQAHWGIINMLWLQSQAQTAVMPCWKISSKIVGLILTWFPKGLAWVQRFLSLIIIIIPVFTFPGDLFNPSCFWSTKCSLITLRKKIWQIWCGCHSVLKGFPSLFPLFITMFALTLHLHPFLKWVLVLSIRSNTPWSPSLSVSTFPFSLFLPLSLTYTLAHSTKYRKQRVDWARRISQQRHISAVSSLSSVALLQAKNTWLLATRWLCMQTFKPCLFCMHLAYITQTSTNAFS